MWLQKLPHILQKPCDCHAKIKMSFDEEAIRIIEPIIQKRNLKNKKLNMFY